MSKAILDTSALIYLEKTGDFSVLKKHAKGMQFAISVITYSEFLMGLHLAKNPVRKLQRQTWLKNYVIDQMPILSINEAIAENHAELAAEMQKAGNIINAHDIWIAATAIHHKAAIITGDDDFSRVVGLKIVKL